MRVRSCIDEAIYCPDISCPRCNRPYTTWVWKDHLIFTCPTCTEFGFSTTGLEIDESRLPRRSFFTEMEWPCHDDPDPNCTKNMKVLFIGEHRSIQLLYESSDLGSSHENYTQVQNAVGRAFDQIMEEISPR
ncbi:MAG: hypothetical protein ACMUIE_02995 [Thermoplasmatota archaeon]